MDNGVFELSEQCIEISSMKRAQWDIIHRCNLDCLHCRVKDREDGIELDLFQKGIRILVSQGLTNITISGGEPFLHRDILPMLDFLSELNVSTFITTNGTVISEEQINRLKQINQRNKIEIQISIDGSEDIHDKIRGQKGCFKLAVNTIGLLLSAEISTRVSMTLSKRNFSEVGFVYDLCSEMGVTGFGFRNAIVVGKQDYKNSLEPNVYKEMIKEYLNKGPLKFSSKDPLVTLLDKSICRNFSFSQIASGEIWGGCAAGIFTLFIDPKGRVTPCAYLPDIILGNLFTDDINFLIRKHPVLLNLRKRANLGGKCGRCDLKYVCGGCRANAFGIKGDYMAEESQCFK